MRILSIEMNPFHLLPYRNVDGMRRIVSTALPFLHAKVDRLPGGLDAILAAADLQGRNIPSSQNDHGKLLGELLAEHCQILTENGLIPSPDKVGVILGGDLYAREYLDRRGGSGDVRPVWNAFARHFRWVAGVAGNHDVIGRTPSLPDFKAFIRQPGIHFLNGNTVELDGLKIAGLSGVVGDNANRPYRRPEADFVNELTRLANLGPDVLVMHDGPVGSSDQRGWLSLREALEKSKPTFVIRGHAHWECPLALLDNGGQVLNVDSRAVLLTR